MALLLIEGFEQYTIGDVAEIPRGGWYSTTAFTATFFTLRAGRHTGGQCCEANFNSTNLTHNVKPSVDFTCGFAFQLLSAGPNGSVLMSFRNNLIDHLYFVLTAAGEIELRRGPSTQLAITSGQGIVTGVWYYLEINARIADGTGGDYDVHLDGSQIFQATSVDTRNGGVAVVDNIEFFGVSVLSPLLDDVYFLDDTGSDNVGLLGDCRVETVFPDATGNENDFANSPAVSAELNVDDGVTPDDDTTYNHSATVTDRDLYGFAALTGDVDTVFAVDAKMLCRKEDAGFREVRVIGRSNVTEVESADKTLGVQYVYKNHIFENDPNGGINWTETSVNAAQFGLDLST